MPAHAPPVVTTTWTLSRFLHRLGEAAAGRAVAWVSAEGVGVAPTISTLGDRRRASGRSIIGLAVFDRSALRAEAIGRRWSEGRFLAWLTASSSFLRLDIEMASVSVPRLRLDAVGDPDGGPMSRGLRARVGTRPSASWEMAIASIM